jgi:hypothetical protein
MTKTTAVLYHAFAITTLYLSVENSVNNPFILDDTSKIVQNQDIRRISNMPRSLFYPYSGIEPGDDCEVCCYFRAHGHFFVSPPIVCCSH